MEQFHSFMFLFNLHFYFTAANFLSTCSSRSDPCLGAAITSHAFGGTVGLACGAEEQLSEAGKPTSLDLILGRKKNNPTNKNFQQDGTV